MKIINTTLESTLLFAIDQTTKIARQYTQHHFELLGIDITVEQWLILKVVKEKSIASQTALARVTHRDPSSITRTLNLLQQKGLLLRVAIPGNKRQFRIELTREGRYFLLQTQPLIDHMRSTSIQNITETDILKTISILEHIQQNLRLKKNNNA